MLVVGRWKAIGWGLQIDSRHLNKIQADNHGDCEECLLGVLTCWLRKNYDVELFGEPMWRTFRQEKYPWSRHCKPGCCMVPVSAHPLHLPCGWLHRPATRWRPCRHQKTVCGLWGSQEGFTASGLLVAMPARHIAEIMTKLAEVREAGIAANVGASYYTHSLEVRILRRPILWWQWSIVLARSWRSCPLEAHLPNLLRFNTAQRKPK